MIYNVDLVNMLIVKVIYMKESGKMTKRKVKEKKFGHLEILI